MGRIVERICHLSASMRWSKFVCRLTERLVRIDELKHHEVDCSADSIELEERIRKYKQ
jgi:hypothetical protein